MDQCFQCDACGDVSSNGSDFRYVHAENGNCVLVCNRCADKHKKDPSTAKLVELASHANTEPDEA